MKVIAFYFQNYTVEIFYFPLILIAPTQDTFLLPIFQELFPFFEDEIQDMMRHCMEFGKADRKMVQSLG